MNEMNVSSGMSAAANVNTYMYPNSIPVLADSKSYVVLDLEMCKVRGSNKEYARKMEIIQIGAVVLDSNFNISNRFDRYVKPQFGRIDSFIRNLTGIKGLDVAHAKSLEEVLQEFIAWMPEGAIMVSWSMTDRDQMFGEMTAKNLHFDILSEKFENWIDCQIMFGKKMDTERRYSLEEALIATDIFTEGDPHNALVDAHNTAMLFAKINTEENFELNPYYKRAHEKKGDVHLSCSIGELLMGIDLSSLCMDSEK